MVISEYMSRVSEVQKIIDAKRFAKAKLKGLTDIEAARIVRPKAKERSLSTIAQRLGVNPLVTSDISKQLDKYDLTIDRALKKLNDLMEASRPLYFKGDYVADIPESGVQAKMAIEILKLHGAYIPPKGPEPAPPIEPMPLDNTELRKAFKDAIDRGDVKAIERIVFNDDQQIDTNTTPKE